MINFTQTDEPTLDDIVDKAIDDARAAQPDYQLAATCSVYRAALIDEMVRLLARRRQPVTHAYNFVESDAGNSHWAEEF